MSTHKHIDTICIVIVLLTLMITILFMNGKALGIAVMVSEENSGEMFTKNDLNASWDTSNATKIALSDHGSTISGNGAYENGGTLYIVYAGKYVISGELSNGKIIIEADGDDKIWLLFDGVSIHCEDDAAIRIEQADKIFLTLKKGTQNTVSSGAVYRSDAIESGIDGTIYARDDLTINGNGSLNVTAKYQHGIVCNDDLVITGGTIDITAVQDGFHAHDSIRIKDADITISAGDDGITVSNDDETSYLYIESGHISIPSCYEGLEAIQITIAGGTIDIYPSDDGINANGCGGSSAIYINGGNITIINENGIDADGLDSNKDIFISGGKVFISVNDSGGSCAIDYGIENGGVCEITGGTVLACGSSGMAEGFDASSAQGFFMYRTSAEAGTTVAIEDADGNELLSEIVPCRFSSIVASTPDMKLGDTYSLSIGENETKITIDNSSTVGNFGGGRIPSGNGFFRDQMPEETSSDSAQPEIPHGGMNENDTPPELPQDAANSHGENIQPNPPQDEKNFSARPDGNNKQKPNDWIADNRQSQEDTSQPADNSSYISIETITLLSVSALVLLIGCIIAFLYKRRG
ncbi:MAG: carbohydrate-binding domain-containing protein [Clostridiales bacterium]|nr:carbohydrate-binding domain-containing protein [Clostridiales bacterium]